MKIKVFSEFGRLREVLVHRPGIEVENLTPDILERLLFDDIPFLRKAQAEHDRFVFLLRSHGVKVRYIEKVTAEVLAADEGIKKQFVEQFIKEAGVDSKHRKALSDFYYSLSDEAMVDAMIGGVDYLTLYKKGFINQLPKKGAYPFLSDPLPNILFQRDPFASVGNGITMHAMKAVTRRRETIFADYVFKYHPRFANEVKRYYERDEKNTLEGGDIMVLNKKTLLIGHTERTEMKAIQTVARNVLADNESSFEAVYAIEVPKKRAFMHLDTVMTCCDFGVFIVHPTIFDHEDEFKIYKVTGSETKEIKKSLSDFFEDVLGQKPKFIRCGGDSPIAAGREQWNDGTNVLAIAPGVVIAYERNHVTNKLLRAAGITVIEIPSSELSRGRGGPRCMSMPLLRDDTNCCSPAGKVCECNSCNDCQMKNKAAACDCTSCGTSCICHSITDKKSCHCGCKECDSCSGKLLITCEHSENFPPCSSGGCSN